MNRREYRRQTYRKHWEELILMYGSICVYCNDAPATVIDHVIPVSYLPIHDIANLRPSCTLCNLIASDKVFETADIKKQFILGERERKSYASQRTICTSCWIPYQRPTHSPSLFLCAECYDEECETDLRHTRAWAEWLGLLDEAEIDIDIFRKFKARTYDMSRRHRRQLLSIFGSIVQESYEA